MSEIIQVRREIYVSRPDFSTEPIHSESAEHDSSNPNHQRFDSSDGSQSKLKYRNTPDHNTHHIFNTRADWETKGRNRELREYLDFMPKMDFDIHQAIHKECNTVHQLGQKALSAILENLPRNAGDTLKSVDRVCSMIDRYEADREIAELAVEALRSQIPYLKEGMMERSEVEIKEVIRFKQHPDQWVVNKAQPRSTKDRCNRRKMIN